MVRCYSKGLEITAFVRTSKQMDTFDVKKVQIWFVLFVKDLFKNVFCHLIYCQRIESQSKLYKNPFFKKYKKTCKHCHFQFFAIELLEVYQIVFLNNSFILIFVIFFTKNDLQVNKYLKGKPRVHKNSLRFNWLRI